MILLGGQIDRPFWETNCLPFLRDKLIALFEGQTNLGGTNRLPFLRDKHIDGQTDCLFCGSTLKISLGFVNKVLWPIYLICPPFDITIQRSSEPIIFDQGNKSKGSADCSTLERCYKFMHLGDCLMKSWRFFMMTCNQLTIFSHQSPPESVMFVSRVTKTHQSQYVCLQSHQDSPESAGTVDLQPIDVAAEPVMLEWGIVSVQEGIMNGLTRQKPGWAAIDHKVTDGCNEYRLEILGVRRSVQHRKWLWCQQPHLPVPSVPYTEVGIYGYISQCGLQHQTPSMEVILAIITAIHLLSEW